MDDVVLLVVVGLDRAAEDALLGLRPADVLESPRCPEPFFRHQAARLPRDALKSPDALSIPDG
jgi:hypothetical protein